MSDTPRTDADCWDTIAGAARCKPTTKHAYVPATLARELERENAALREDKERLDAIRHGWRISCEEGSAANLRSDRWFIWTRDWSQPIGEGNSLRAAIDAARAKEAKP